MTSLRSHYQEEFPIEIGIDEAGRGPMFGRLYVAAAVLPKPDEFDHSLMKDSKKFYSKKKIREAYEYIKTNALAWSVQYIEHDEIDNINIRQSVFKGMHKAIKEIIGKMGNQNIFLLVDGNDFKPFTYFDSSKECLVSIPHETIEGGDNTFSHIAAASILAKVERDEYISTICSKYPELKERYNLHTNQGYGTKKHLEGIRLHGISQWHRRSYGLCKQAHINPVTEEIIETNRSNEI